jgi:hypothetical protein
MEYEEKLNDDWIYNFEKTDKLYHDFYKDNLYYTSIHFIYVNRTNEIEKIRQEPFLMNVPNKISREEIIGILKRNSTDNNRKYTLLSILKYNITIDVEDIKTFLTTEDISLYNECFLTPVKNIDTIFFEKSISMFHDLNDLLFIFYEKSNELKKIDPNNVTKKIILNRSNRKTIKKQYTD